MLFVELQRFNQTNQFVDVTSRGRSLTFSEWTIRTGLKIDEYEKEFTINRATCGSRNIEEGKITATGNAKFTEEDKAAELSMGVCLLVTNEPVDLVPFPISSSFENKLILAGYHPELKNKRLTSDSFVHDAGLTRSFQECNLLKTYASRTRLLHDCDTLIGSSGAPLLKYTSSQWYLVGVHTGSAKSRGNIAHVPNVDGFRYEISSND